MSENLSPQEGEPLVVVPSVEVVPETAPIAAPPTESTDWEAIHQDEAFRGLIRKKQSFIIPTTIFFLVYYFGFLILVGYFPSLVETNVIGNINIAYLFALSQFIVAWVLVFLYVRQANVFDRLAAAVTARWKGK